MSHALTTHDIFPQIHDPPLTNSTTSTLSTPIYLPISHTHGPFMFIPHVNAQNAHHSYFHILPKNAKGRVVKKTPRSVKVWTKSTGPHIYDQYNRPIGCNMVARTVEANENETDDLTHLLVYPHGQQDKRYPCIECRWRHDFIDASNGNYIQISPHNVASLRIEIKEGIWKEDYAGPIVKIVEDAGVEPVIMLCEKTLTIWVLSLDMMEDRSKQFRLCRSNCIYDDTVTFKEQLVVPYKGKKSCNPHVKILETKWKATIGDEIIFVYSGDRQLFYIDTRHPVVLKCPKNVEKETSFMVEGLTALCWKRVNLWHNVQPVMKEITSDFRIQYHRGKVYVLSAQEAPPGGRKRDNLSLHVWDLYRGALESITLPSIAYNVEGFLVRGDSLFVDMWKHCEKVHFSESEPSWISVAEHVLMRVKLRCKTMEFQSVDREFSDVDVVCCEGTPRGERVPLGGSRLEQSSFAYHAPLMTINDAGTFAVPDDLTFIRLYAQSNGHRLPSNLIGQGDRIQMIRTVIVDEEPEDNSTKNAANAKKSPTQTKTRKKRKGEMDDEQYLEDLAYGVQYDLISPLVGDDLLVKFEE